MLLDLSSINIRNEFGVQLVLEHRSSKFGSRTINIPQASNGNCLDVTTCLRNKAEKWGDQVLIGHSPKQES